MVDIKQVIGALLAGLGGAAGAYGDYKLGRMKEGDELLDTLAKMQFQQMLQSQMPITPYQQASLDADKAYREAMSSERAAERADTQSYRTAQTGMDLKKLLLESEAQQQQRILGAQEKQAARDWQRQSKSMDIESELTKAMLPKEEKAPKTIQELFFGKILGGKQRTADEAAEEARRIASKIGGASMPVTSIPAGAVGKAPDQQGNMHWVDKNGQDLGLVQ